MVPEPAFGLWCQGSCPTTKQLTPFTPHISPYLASQTIDSKSCHFSPHHVLHNPHDRRSDLLLLVHLPDTKAFLYYSKSPENHASRENYASELHQAMILRLSRVGRTSCDLIVSHGFINWHLLLFQNCYSPLYENSGKMDLFQTTRKVRLFHDLLHRHSFSKSRTIFKENLKSWPFPHPFNLSA